MKTSYSSKINDHFQLAGYNVEDLLATDEPETESSSEDELVFAHVMYRHGERDIPKKIELTNVILALIQFPSVIFILIKI